MPPALVSKFAYSLEAACSNSAFFFGSVGIRFDAGYLAAIYRQIARDSYRMKPLSSCR
jgi:hypothetical protein